MKTFFWVLLSSFGLPLFAGEVPTVTILDPSALDKSVSPCEDFYRYACGGWMKRTEIPPDRSQWARSFTEISERNLKLEREILEKAAAGNGDPKNPDSAKLGDYYAVCMDEKKAETASLKTLKEQLAAVQKWKSPDTLAPLLAALHLEGEDALFGFGSFQDFKNSDQMIGAVDQGGLSLPDRDYYLSQEGKMPEIRRLFHEHMIKIFELLGDKKAVARKEADTILALETALAKVSLSRVQRRDPNQVYHRLGVDWLKKNAPGFRWDDYFAALNKPKVDDLNVAVPDFFVGLEKLMKSTPIENLRIYLRWHLVEVAIPALGQAFVNEAFRFTSTALSGEKKIKDRWKRCVSSTEGAMGEPLGRTFVLLTFGEDGKKRSKEMVARIEDALRDDLKEIPWMDDSTKKAALKKLDKVFNQIGYPDKWRDFSGLKIDRASYLHNRLAANEFNSRYDLGKIGKPVDRTEWLMPPQEVNAYYSPENNQMVFPAGILQVPFFSVSAPLPMSYGGIGMVMGHELTHGFDDQGRRFDERGNLRDWWTPKVEKEFTARAQCLVKQYAAYTPVDALHVNGELTLGENIADQGGIRLGYAAFPKSSEEKGPDGYTPTQEYFLAFAQSWCTKRRPELQRMLITVDPHSPPEARVNGPLVNFPKFAEAFGCKAGNKMVAAQGCEIW